MKAKSIYLMFLVVSMLILSFTIMRTAETQESTAWIAVNPSSYEARFSDFFDPSNTTHPYEGKFTVEINVSANDLYGFEYGFIWNNTLLNVTNMSITPPWGNCSVNRNETTDLGDGRSQHFLFVFGESPSSPFNGSTTVCNYTFYVKHQPYFPEPDGYSLLDLEDAVLIDHEEELINHDTYDGEYRIKQEKVPIISLTPINWTLGVNSNCIIDIMVINVTSKPEYSPLIKGVHGFDFRLLYNTTCLQAVDVTLPPGHFLTPTDPNNIFIAKKDIDNNYSDTYGQVWVAAALLDPEKPKNGSGVLARINFTITAEECASPLRFYIKPGFPFPITLVYRKVIKPYTYVIPCMSGLGKAQTLTPSTPPLSIPIQYIFVIVILISVIGLIAHYYRKRREYRKEEEEYKWILEEGL